MQKLNTLEQDVRDTFLDAANQTLGTRYTWHLWSNAHRIDVSYDGGENAVTVHDKIGDTAFVVSLEI